MSTRTNHTQATTTSGPALSTVRRTGRDMGMIVCPAEVALLRVSSKPGAEGNELILRSGVTVQLTYAEAVQLREELLLVEAAATDDRHLRKMLLEVAC